MGTTMNPILLIIPVERGCHPEGCLKVANSLIYAPLQGVYFTKEVVQLADKS